MKLAFGTRSRTATELLRRPTRTNHAGVTVLITQLRTMLDSIERDTWPNRPPE
jgi:hypothetical protein